MHFIIENLPQYVYRRGGRVYRDLEWAVSGKAPRTKQFVLTSSDYCKLYVTVVKFHMRRASRSVPIECGEDFVYVPVALGVMSRTPYLAFPKVFLSHMYHSVNIGERQEVRPLLVRSLAQMMHAVPLPLGPFSQSVWSLPRLCRRVKHQCVLSISDVGLEGSPFEEGKPMPSAFTRGISEVDLTAVLDLLPIESIVFCLNALLLEQKLLLVSSKYSSSFIAHICEALRVLMYPFDWAHVFVPLIPSISLQDGGIPLWIESALNSDHIHPLRVLEAPAPVLAGLRVKNNSSVSVSYEKILRERFIDLNIANLDSGSVFPASQRVDRVNAPLPVFPRKLVAAIISRLEEWSSSNDDISRKERIEKYLKWDMIVPESFFTRYNAPLDNYEDAYSSKAPTRRTSTVTFESAIETPPLKGSRFLQAAVLEAFTKLLFSYREFFFLDSFARAVSIGAASFAGSDRHFYVKQFLKCSERHQGAGSDVVSFLRALLSTQAWDLFVRTSALSSVSSVFDNACTIYASINKVDYFKYKQFVAATVSAGSGLHSCGISDLAVPAAVPSGKKPKEFYLFDQLLAYMNRLANHPDLVMYSQEDVAAIPFTVHPESVMGNDSLETLARVVNEDLPRLFPDPNQEAYKLMLCLAATANDRIFSLNDLICLREAFPLIRAGKMESHFIHFALKDVSDLGFAPPLIESSSSPVASQVVIDSSVSSAPRTGDLVGDNFSVWSGLSRQFNRNNAILDDSRLLGGIPRSAIPASRFPQVPIFMLRNFTAPSISVRYIFRLHDVIRIDFQCTGCGTASSLLHVLQMGRFFESSTCLSDPISVTCEACSVQFSPEIVHKTGRFKIFPILRSVQQLHALPISLETHLNLSLLLGLQFELHEQTASDKRKLRGLVSFPELVADFLACTSLHLNQDDDGSASTHLVTATSPVALAMVPSPLRSESIESSRANDSSSSVHSELTLTPYKKLALKARSKHRVIKIHVDPPPRSANSSLHRRKTTNLGASSPSHHRKAPSPPSDKRPFDAAPRRARKSITPESNDTQLPN